MLMMDEKNQARTWWAIAWSMVERALLTYEKAPLAFIALAAIFYAPSVAYEIANPPLPPWAATVIACTLFAGAIVLTSAGVMAAFDPLDPREAPSLARAFSGIFSRLGPLLATTVICGVLQCVGLLLLLIPGIVVLFWTVFAGPVTYKEGVQGWEALRRSRQLIGDGRWIQVAGVLLAAFAVLLFLGMLPKLAVWVYLKLGTVEHEVSRVWHWALLGWGWMINITAISFVSTWIATAYHDVVEITAMNIRRPSPRLDLSTAGVTSDPKERSRPPASRPGGGPPRPRG